MDDIQNHSKSNDKHEEAVQGDDITVLDYFRAIYKYVRMRLLICRLAVVRPAIISLLLPKTCYATASVAPPIEILQIEQSFGKRNSSSPGKWCCFLLCLQHSLANILQRTVGIAL